MFALLDVPGATLTLPDAITNDGDVVGFSEIGPGKAVGFHLWRGVVDVIAYPGAQRTAARGINRRGDIVGRFQLPDGRWFGFLKRAKRT